MKKTFIFSLMLSLILSLTFVSCDKNKKQPVTPDVKKDTTLVVENTINLDKQQMFTTYGKNYRWFESCIVLNDYLDSENCDGSFESVTNIFQALIGDINSKSFDSRVVMFTHNADSVEIVDRQGFWIEDCPMNDDVLKLTYKDAFDKVMTTNSPKPHSKNCILRKPLGSLDCNPQYIFGNLSEQLWVDAVTGEVRNSNPAFPDNMTLKYAFPW
ncbi:hypothetical protein J6O48_13755 [bacterium]|nr:hypothetical protein [bacterium]